MLRVGLCFLELRFRVRECSSNHQGTCLRVIVSCRVYRVLFVVYPTLWRFCRDFAVVLDVRACKGCLKDLGVGLQRVL